MQEETWGVWGWFRVGVMAGRHSARAQVDAGWWVWDNIGVEVHDGQPTDVYLPKFAGTIPPPGAEIARFAKSAWRWRELCVSGCLPATWQCPGTAMQRYLLSHRRPWYRQEQRPTPASCLRGLEVSRGSLCCWRGRVGFCHRMNIISRGHEPHVSAE